MSLSDAAAPIDQISQAPPGAHSLRLLSEVAMAVIAATDLSLVLHQIVHAVSASMGISSVSLLLLDEQSQAVCHAATLGLPEDLVSSIDGLVIGPATGSCGTAMYRAETIVTDDLLADPLWEGYRHLVAPYGLRACWSFPLLSSQMDRKSAIGCLAVYLPRPSRPTPEQRELLDMYAHLAAVAVHTVRLREAEQAAARTAERRADEMAALITHLPHQVFYADADGHVLDREDFVRYVHGAPLARPRLLADLPHLFNMRSPQTGRPLSVGELGLQRALQGHEGVRQEVLVIDPNSQREHYMIAVAQPMRSGSGDVTGAFLAMSDVSDYRALLQTVTDTQNNTRAILESIPCGLLVMDAQGNYTSANPTAVEILGWSEADLLRPGSAHSVIRSADMDGRPITEDDRRRMISMVIQTGQSLRGGLHRITRADGEHRWLLFDISALPVDPEQQRLLSSFVDVTAIMQAEAAVRNSEERYRALIGTTPIGCCITDELGMVQEVNSAFCTLFGYTMTDMVGRLLGVLPNEDQDADPLSTKPVGWSSQQEIQATHRQGHHMTILVSTTVLPPHGDGRRIAYFVIDVTEHRMTERRLDFLAHHDMLTRLPNRLLFTTQLEQMLGVFQSQSGDTLADGSTGALLLFDLDRFKDINDTLGHNVGDSVLQTVAQRLRAVIEPAATVARLGGDEFAVLLPHVDQERALYMARQIVAVLSEPQLVDVYTLTIDVSVGVVFIPEHGRDVSTLLRHADVAMYLAKSGGEGIEIYSVRKDRHTPERLAMANDLRHAIARQELQLHYQPLYGLRERGLTGVEALLRWKHPAYGSVPPDVFIPMAEYTGMIGPLTIWVLEEAARQQQDWWRRGWRLRIAINLSLGAIYDEAFPTLVGDVLSRYALPPSWLTLEVTESTLMSDPERMQDVLTRLASLGVRLSVDDFGTGYSSLARLRRLPMHEIKIDRSFVHDIQVHANDDVIVSSIISLGHNLGLRVVAEGVEDQTTWNYLYDLGCDTIQGYHLSRPQAADDFLEWLERHGWALTFVDM